MGQGRSLAYRFKFLKILDSGMLSPHPVFPHKVCSRCHQAPAQTSAGEGTAARATSQSPEHSRSLFNLSQHLGCFLKPVPGH